MQQELQQALEQLELRLEQQRQPANGKMIQFVFKANYIKSLRRIQYDCDILTVQKY